MSNRTQHHVDSVSVPNQEQNPPKIPIISDNLTLREFQREFARLDILLHRQIERQQAATQVDSDGSQLSAYYMTAAQAYKRVQQHFGMGSVAPLADETIYNEALFEAEQTNSDTRTDSSCFSELVNLLGLDDFARDVLLICLAPALDLRYGDLYAYLQDDLTRKWPSVNLILDLLCPSNPERLLYLRYFTEESALWHYRLVSPNKTNEHIPLLNQTIRPDENIVLWLTLQQYQPPAFLQPYMEYTVQPNPELPILTDDKVDLVQTAIASNAVISFYGVNTAAQNEAALLLAYETERSCIQFDLATALSANLPIEEVIRYLLRDALLTSSIVYITGFDRCLVDGTPPTSLVREFFDYPGLIILAGQIRWQPHYQGSRRRLFWLEFPDPDYQERLRLLHYFLDVLHSRELFPIDDLDLSALAQQFQLTTDQLRNLTNTAVDDALLKGEPLNNEHMFAAARFHSQVQLTALAQKMKARFHWDELILPDEQITMLQEFANAIRYRMVVLDEWNVGSKLVNNGGITALFSGEPGTGKTMAAGVIAGVVGLDFYRIDLSGVISKYVGETEKNLEQIFSEADRSNTILFFDEADAIFGKRSEVKDARDRFANIEISYLLQRMETYNGITILATNLKTNLDNAFMRRMQFHIDFPEPDAKLRERIWKALFPANVPHEPNLDWEWFANKFTLTGGNIRNIIVAATYLAASDGQVVTMDHLRHATSRELHKMGRIVNLYDF